MADFSPFSKTLYALSGHRHLVLATGVCLLLLGAWHGWQPSSTPPATASDTGFDELDGFAATSDPQFGELPALVAPSPASGALQWGQPELPPSPTDQTAFNMTPPAPSTEAFAPLALPSTAPAWLAGTIEAVDETPTLPDWIPSEHDLRYSRNTKSADAAAIR